MEVDYSSSLVKGKPSLVFGGVAPHDVSQFDSLSSHTVSASSPFFCSFLSPSHPSPPLPHSPLLPTPFLLSLTPPPLLSLTPPSPYLSLLLACKHLPLPTFLAQIAASATETVMEGASLLEKDTLDGMNARISGHNYGVDIYITYSHISIITLHYYIITL